MKVGLIGAYDRNNFGDLLMPILFEKQYREKNKNSNVTFEYFGQTNSNMEYLKSYNTKALYKAYNNIDIAIIVGGEVLSANYKLMYFNLQKNKIKIFFLRCLNKLFPNFVEKMARKILKGKSERPWILDKNDIGCKKIIYNTVGGNFGDNNEILRSIKKVDYMAIRNVNDFKIVSKYNKNTRLYPDSVVAISKYIDEDELKNNTETDIFDICKEEYFIIQIDKRDGKKLINTISTQINKICNEKNIKCILLPIGYAQGHEDQVVLKKIMKECDNKNVVMPRMTNIYETMYILKHAQMFIGTSLHGIILSTSYCVPHMILTSKLNKLLNYMNTWETSTIHYTEAENIFENFIKLNKDAYARKLLQEKSKELIKLAEENFDNINDIINEEY